MSQLKQRSEGPSRKAPPPQQPAAPTQRAGLAGQRLDAQRAALSPRTAPGLDAQRAAVAPAAQAKAELAAIATAQVEQAAAEHDATPTAPHKASLARRIGDRVGLALGIAVTRVLQWVPGWNDVLVDEQGQELQSIEGAERSGDHPLRKRHTQVVGPQISAWVQTLSPGRVREFLAGVGDGATRAPGETYRREVAAADGR